MASSGGVNESSRLIRFAPAVGIGSAVAAAAIAGALATGVISDANATTGSGHSASHRDHDRTGGLDGTAGIDGTGGLGVPSQGQGPVARSNGS